MKRKALTPDMAILIAAVVGEGYPEPEREFRFWPERRFRFDLAFPAYKVAFEREGATWTGGRHSRGKGMSSDAEKYNQAAIFGWLVIRGTADMLRNGTALTQLLDALKSRENRAA